MKFEPVRVPAGFVTLFDSIPRAFWSLLGTDGTLARAGVIHDYLYWKQSRSREEADEIFKLVLQDSGVDASRVNAMYVAARLGGQASWDENVRLKAQGERRVLKTFPTEPQTTWSDWKKRAGVFVE